MNLYFSKIEGEIYIFEQNFRWKLKVFGKAFRKLNCLSQEVVRFLLTTEGEEKKVLSRLIENIFGKLAKIRFLKKGIRNEFLKKEKKMVVCYIQDFLGQFNSDAHGLFFTKKVRQQTCEENANLVYNFTNGEIKIQEKKKSFSGTSLGKNLRKRASFESEGKSADATDPKLMDLLKMNNVPSKYIDHLLWLDTNMCDTEKARSFRSLVLEAYSLHFDSGVNRN